MHEYDVQGEGIDMGKQHTVRKIPASFAGLGVMLLLSAVMVFLLPVCILNEYLPTEYTHTFIIISMGIIAFVGSGIACLLTRERLWETGALAVGMYYILLIAIAVFFFDGLNLHVLCSVIAGALGCVSAFVVLMIQKKHHGKRKKRRGYR